MNVRLTEEGWEEALELVVATFRCETYRRICAETHPDYHGWRLRMVVKAAEIRAWQQGPPERPPEANGHVPQQALLRPPPGASPQYPPIRRQAATLAASLWDWATAGFKVASEALVERRRGICAGCDQWVGPARRCRLCGCRTEAKIRMKTEHCPINKW